MTTTFENAVNEILDVFHTAWTPRPAAYPNVSFTPPAGSSDPWARVSLAHVTGNQATLSNPTGQKRWRRNGILTVQVFTPLGEGLSEGYSLAKVVADAYEGTATPSQVWFRNVRINEVGPDGEWFQTNVLVDFTYDEIK